MRLAHLLKKSPLFAGLTDAEVQRIAEHGIKLSRRKGTTILRSGEPAFTFFVLLSGRAKACMTSPDGREFILCIFGPGDYFCHTSLCPKLLHSAEVTAIEDCQLFVIEAQLFMEELHRHPTLAVNMALLLTQKLSEVYELIRGLVFGSAQQRIAHTLLHLASVNRTKDTNGTPLKCRLTNQQLADLTGCRRETVSRLLANLKRQKIVLVNEQGIAVLNPQALEELANQRRLWMPTSSFYCERCPQRPFCRFLDDEEHL